MIIYKMNLVDVKKLSFDFFSQQVLFDINLDINENEKVLLIGANGAGKSTLIRLLAGVHNTFNYNTLNVMGKNSPMDQFNGLAYLGNRWVRNISFMGQTVYTADIYVKDMMKKLQHQHLDRRNELVNVLDIDLDWKMHQISDGQRKKVQIMLSLLKPFKLLLIDEFISELDILARNHFFEYLNKECKERNASIIYATHILDNIHQWATHVVYISNGKCEPKKTISEFQTDYTLYDSIKMKLEQDRWNRQIIEKSFDKSVLGSQGGWGSGDQVIFYKYFQIFIKNSKSNKCQKTKQNLKN